MPDPSPSDLNLEQLSRLKAATANHIAEVLNRFSVQTGLEVEAVVIDKLYVIGSAQSYAIDLDIRL